MNNRSRLNILLISNGYGEDTVAANIGSKLKLINPSFHIAAFPTVGTGKFYLTKNIPIAGYGPELPSEGFVRSIKDFIKDVLHGFFKETIKMGLDLKRVSQNFDYMIIAGDPYILLFTSIFSKKSKEKKIFIGLQQSEWYGSKKPFKEHYSYLERLWLKWFAGIIFTRDKITRDFLLSKGLNNVFSYGNPMMDCFSIHKDKIFPSDRTLIGILPGSKQEAYDNIQKIFEVIEILDQALKDAIFAFAISPNLDIDKIMKLCNLQEDYKPSLQLNRKEGILYLKHQNINGQIILSKEIFGNIISEAKAIIGLSGTANEQAVGMGKPVFSFWGKGPQITKKFLDAQKRLLGQSLFAMPPEPRLVAKKIIEVLKDKELLKSIEENGKIRMEGRGSIDKIVNKIYQYITSIEGT